MFDWLRWVDATFSTYKEDSEISRLEPRRARARRRASATCARCSTAARSCASRRDGYFDMRAALPDAIDPSGLVKGWAVDRAAAILDEAGVRELRDQRRRRHALARPRAARAVLARRDPASARARRASPRSSRRTISRSRRRARTRAATTSLDPHTRRPPAGVLSVTITGPELATADAYATAAFAMGEAGPHWTARLRGYEAMTILADGRVLSTPGFPS